MLKGVYDIEHSQNNSPLNTFLNIWQITFCLLLIKTQNLRYLSLFGGRDIRENTAHSMKYALLWVKKS